MKETTHREEKKKNTYIYEREREGYEYDNQIICKIKKDKIFRYGADIKKV